MVASLVKAGTGSITGELSALPDNTWTKAVTRLNGIGVFADEHRKLPVSSTLSYGLSDFENALRSKGYKGGRIAIADLDEPIEGISFLIFDSDRIGDPRSAQAIWYREYLDRWHARVQERVQDWISRLEKLKVIISGWLPENMSIRDRSPTRLHEELMARFNVPPANMPTFEIYRGPQRIMRVQPKGLFVIGANGRLDLVTATKSWILVDRAEPLSGEPDWNYYAPDDRQKPTKLDKNSFLNVLSQSL